MDWLAFGRTNPFHTMQQSTSIMTPVVIVTAVWQLSRVDTLVSRQISTSTERFPTDVTLVRFLTGMHKVMTGQTIQHNERLPADITAVWPLSRVQTPVFPHAT